MDIITSRHLKGIAISLVVAGHSYLILGLPKIFIWAGAWGVSIFVILSGYGLTLSFQKNGLNGFVRKKLSKIFIPYFIVTSSWILINTFILNKIYSIKEIFLSLTGIYNYFDSSMWYIGFIFLLYIIFFIGFSLPIKNNIIRLFVISVLCLSLKSLYHGYVLLFPLGIWFALYEDRIKKYHILSIGILTFMIFIFSNKTEIQPLLYTITYTSCAISIFCFFYYTKLIIKPLTAIGAISYEIYLFEGLLNAYNIPNITSYRLANIVIYFFMLSALSSLLNKIVNNHKIINIRINKQKAPTT